MVCCGKGQTGPGRGAGKRQGEGRGEVAAQMSKSSVRLAILPTSRSSASGTLLAIQSRRICEAKSHSSSDGVMHVVVEDVGDPHYVMSID